MRMAKCRNRKRPVAPYPPDAAEVVNPSPGRKDTRKWCRGIEGREHYYAEPLLAALHYAEKRTGLWPRMTIDQLYQRYGGHWHTGGSYMILECEHCGKQKYTPRNIWRRRGEKVPGVEYEF